MSRYVVWACLFCVFFSTGLYAEEIIFENGDRITATILRDSKGEMTVSSQALGTVTLDRSFIVSPSYEETAAAAPEQKQGRGSADWTRSMSLGYSLSGGNTINKEANTSVHFNRKTDKDEATFRASTYYSSADHKMDSQKAYGLARYAFSFGEVGSWYNFYKLEADHDRFADVDYRLIPTIGAGKWIADTEKWKILGELAGGGEHTNYRSGKDSTTEFVFVPRGYFKKLFLKDFWIEQDLTAYFVPENPDQYRLRSESSLTHKLTEKISWKLSFVDDYTADPAGAAKKNDYRLIYSLDYSF